MAGATLRKLFKAQKQMVILFAGLLVIIVLLLGAAAQYAARFYRTNTLSAEETFSLRASMAYNELTAYTTLAHWAIDTAERAAAEVPEHRAVAALQVLQRHYKLARWTEWAVVDLENSSIVHQIQDETVTKSINALPELNRFFRSQSVTGTVVILRLADGTREPAVAWPINLGDGTLRAALLRVDLAEILRPMTEPLDTELQIDLVDESGGTVMPLSIGDSETGHQSSRPFTLERPQLRDTNEYATAYGADAVATPRPMVHMEDDAVFSFVPIPTVAAGFVLQDRHTLTASRIRRMFWIVGVTGTVLIALLVHLFRITRRNLLVQGARLSRTVADKDSLLLLLSHKLRNTLTAIDAEVRRLEVPRGTLDRSVRRLSRIVADALYYSQFHYADETIPNPPQQVVTCADIMEFLAVRLSDDAAEAGIDMIFVPPSPYCTTQVDFSTALDALERIILLVISDAEPGFQCTIQASETEERATVRVKVPPKSMQRFSRFSYSPPDLTDNARMNGVDLYVAYRLLDSIGGTLRCTFQSAELLIDLPGGSDPSDGTVDFDNLSNH